MWLLIALAPMGAELTSAPAIVPIKMTAELRGGSGAVSMETCRFESTNFVVHSNLRPSDADEVARHCEMLYCQLRRRCFGTEAIPSWRPKCAVVLHANRQSYVQAVGPRGGQTTGSSVVGINGVRITKRRIDLFAEDRHHALSALPHELVHVLLAELFPDAAAPRWAEEGFALLNDPEDKRARHLHDLHDALRTKTTLPLQSLFAAKEYPTGWHCAVFYGQSMSLVEYLTSLDTHQQFLRFAKVCMEMGGDHALKTVYGINGFPDLESRWHKHATASVMLRSKTSPQWSTGRPVARTN